MLTKPLYKPDPRLDLVLERVVDVPPELVWKAWTTPEHLQKWFTPAPWKTIACEIDLRPGGLFRTVTLAPDGEEQINSGCYLDIVENRRLVWTDALVQDYRPAAAPNICFGRHFTAIVGLEPADKGTKYTVTCLHSDEQARQDHAEKGFQDGWGAALDQLVAWAKSGRP